jgi:hypothetical protein
MRRTMVVGAVVGATILAGSSALAAPPEVSQKSCEASGGTFSRDQGVKSCSRVTATEAIGSPIVQDGPVNPFTSSFYRGASQRVYSVEVTTTQSQKGNGEVVTTMSGPVTVGSRMEPLACLLVDFDPFTQVVMSQLRPLSECAARGLFVA